MGDKNSVPSEGANEGANMSANMRQQLEESINRKAINSTINKDQFNEILTMFSITIHSVQHVPILDGLYGLIQPVGNAKSKPKQCVLEFLVKMANDPVFLEESKGLCVWVYVYVF